MQTSLLHACRWVSLLGAAMSAMYSTIAFAASVAAGSQGASYELRRESRALQIFGAFNALGTVMFAFGGHAILLEVQVRSCRISLHSPDLFCHRLGRRRGSCTCMHWLRVVLSRHDQSCRCTLEILKKIAGHSCRWHPACEAAAVPCYKTDTAQTAPCIAGLLQDWAVIGSPEVMMS